MYPPILKTDRITLKAYVPENEDRRVEIDLDPVSTRFMGGSTDDEIQEREAFRSVFNLYKRNAERWHWVWGIYTDDLLCGHLELKDTVNTNENELEIVYMIHPEERRKGIMTDTLLLLKQNQKSWKRRLIATVSPENTSSISLLEKIGIDKKEILVDPESGSETFKLTLAE